MFTSLRRLRLARLQNFLSSPPSLQSAPSLPSRSYLVRAHRLPHPARKATRHSAHTRTHRPTRPPRRRQNQPPRIKSLLPPRHLHRLNQRLPTPTRSEEHTSELQSRSDLVCRLLLEKK